MDASHRSDPVAGFVVARQVASIETARASERWWKIRLVWQHLGRFSFCTCAGAASHWLLKSVITLVRVSSRVHFGLDGAGRKRERRAKWEEQRKLVKCVRFFEWNSDEEGVILIVATEIVRFSFLSFACKLVIFSFSGGQRSTDYRSDLGITFAKYGYGKARKNVNHFNQECSTLYGSSSSRSPNLSAYSEKGRRHEISGIRSFPLSVDRWSHLTFSYKSLGATGASTGQIEVVSI